MSLDINSISKKEKKYAVEYLNLNHSISKTNMNRFKVECFTPISTGIMLLMYIEYEKLTALRYRNISQIFIVLLGYKETLLGMLRNSSSHDDLKTAFSEFKDTFLQSHSIDYQSVLDELILSLQMHKNRPETNVNHGYNSRLTLNTKSHTKIEGRFRNWN